MEPDVQYDVLVYAAGTEGEIARIRESHLDLWQETFRVNLEEFFLFLRGEWVRPGGRIVALSSVHALPGAAGAAAYAASKAALESLVRSAAQEYAAKGTTVNALRVGFMDAGMFHRLPPAAKSLYLSRVPSHAPGDPEALAAAVYFLCSADAGYITGQVIDFDGGYLLGWMGR